MGCHEGGGTIPVLNHHIVAARDKAASSLFFAEVLGLDHPVGLGPFAAPESGAPLVGVAAC